jgi:hypothetical protein
VACPARHRASPGRYPGFGIALELVARAQLEREGEETKRGKGFGIRSGVPVRWPAVAEPCDVQGIRVRAAACLVVVATQWQREVRGQVFTRLPRTSRVRTFAPRLSAYRGNSPPADFAWTRDGGLDLGPLGVETPGDQVTMRDQAYVGEKRGFSLVRAYR